MFPVIAKLLVPIKRLFGDLYLNKRVATIRYGVAKGLKRRGGIGIIGLLKKERSENIFLRKLSLEGKTVYDIGGNFGAFTLFFSRAVGPNGKVCTFEPLAENCVSIRENARLNRMTNVQVIQTGVGDKRETMEITYDPVDTATASFVGSMKKNVKNKEKARSIEMQVDSLDNLIASQSLPQPDFVKIDVEGMEMHVLKGMQEVIRRSKPQLFIEIHPDAVASKDILDLLAPCGYTLFSVEADEPVTADNVSRITSGHYFCS